MKFKCEDCKIRKGIVHFSNEPMLTITHGWGGKHICRECYIERIESHIKDCQEQLKEQRELLEVKK